MAKGLDIGTSALVTMFNEVSEDKEEVKVKKVRDCYIEIEDEDDFVEVNGQMPLITIGDKKVVLGEDSLKLANWLKAPVKRPMRLGVLNPLDDDAYNVLEALIASILGEAKTPGEICVASIPAESFDSTDTNTVVHAKAAEQMITKLGYEFHPINEGFATLLALNPKLTTEDGMELSNTGIAVSFGGGMSNACLGFRSKELLTLSVARGGDSIDEKVAATFKDVKPNQVTAFKEKFFEFGKTYTEEEIESFGYKTTERKAFFNKMMNNLNSYYEDLIDYVIKSFSAKFIEEERHIDEALEVVIAGGTSAPKGFENKFAEVLSRSNFPIQVSRVRKASDENVLNCTATGAFIWAKHLESKRK